MKQSESIAALAAALVKANAEFKAVKVDSQNPDFRSTYVSRDAIIESLRPVLAKHGLTVVQGCTAPHTDEASRLAAFSVETMLIHASGEWLTNTVIVPVVGRAIAKEKGGGFGDVTPQSAGSAISYGSRYGLSAFFCIATDDDDDGATASAPRASQPRTEKPAAERLMPFGKQKGKKLGEISSADLESTIEWCSKDDASVEKFKDLIESCSSVVRDRLTAQNNAVTV